ncbi:hypothetical protein [Cytophaga hutchinsonii]|uniref:DUF4595 domain-containing protein n=1 Tax=Cytophaga hutchinsonii (strain ATCC 33406 / DSM 1761 / CIP 103989 / NBRC 15051 / NCIMB 9469 / D465) TaxID=269798 RepID=A0A6N4SS88_CYTH3|nr:hypothetical protein [Cytophaga hutchinsonii]ABG59168.1 hypothetical protein CHU_1902 [Cytophaga hutchinsonii ATCC 33406]SFX35142.1 hypothetical protein SAMN04487930_103140 [Cytophaga hutchinsonii ATCC 33406]
MKTHILKSAICLLSILFIATACKKNKEDETPAPASETCTLKYVVDSEIGDSTALVYDEQNRISKVQYYDETGAEGNYITYTYGTNKITYVIHDDEGEHATYLHLNAAGTIDYLAMYNEFNGGTVKQSDTIFYTYNAEGYNIQKVQKYESVSGGMTYSGKDTTWNTYVDGNLITEKEKRDGGKIIITTNTYTSILSKGIFDSNLLIPGIGGKENKNLLKSTSNNDDSDTYSYIYEINPQGYVSRSVSTYKHDGKEEETDLNFYYNCK